jgi:hypothetical protein
MGAAPPFKKTLEKTLTMLYNGTSEFKAQYTKGK